MRRLEIPRAYQAVQRALEEAILTGRLPPGQPLPTETELAAQFGVTRHTVREGMRALEQSGLVKRDLGRRLHVTLPSHDALAPKTSNALLMQRVSFMELWQVAMSIEVCAIELAMENGAAGLAERLDQNIAATERALEQGCSIVALDVEFHALIAEAAKNRVLLLSREPVSMLFYPSLDILFSHPKTRTVAPARLVKAHKEIAKAVAEKDRLVARTWMERHMADFRRGYDYAGLSLAGTVGAATEPPGTATI
jgi:DNA-binding FadR family transcriptional regulator